MEPSWFVTPACCGGLFLHPAIVKVIGVMAPVIRSAASNLAGEKRIGFSTWFWCRLYGLLDHSERKDACPSPEGSKERGGRDVHPNPSGPAGVSSPGSARWHWGKF